MESPIRKDFRAALTKMNHERFVSAGHAGGRYDMDVYVSPAVIETRGQRAFAVGSQAVAVHFENADGGAGPLMMMEKEDAGFDEKHGNWRYVVVEGPSIADGPLEACANCHSEAPQDHLFRVE